MRSKQLFLTFMFSIMSFVVKSQVGDPGGNPDQVPITGLEYLLIGGGAYGVSRLLKNRKNKP